ncbi:MAG: sugar-binding protein [Lentisphaeria bacterium]
MKNWLKKVSLLVALTSWGLSVSLLGYSVGKVNGPISIDGKLNEKSWTQTETQKNFSFLQTPPQKGAPAADTAFVVLVDAQAIYFGVTCQEPFIEKLRSATSSATGNPWVDDVVEIFLSPSGLQENFYQFVIGAGGGTWQQFTAEGGNIRPDPFAPLYEVATGKGKDSWTIEMRLPLWAFYMTSAAQWSDTWLLNICRDRKPVKELSSWSVLERRFPEPKNFRKVSGFPKKQPMQDLRVTSVTAELSSQLSAELTLGQLQIEFTALPQLQLQGRLEVSADALRETVIRDVELSGREQYSFTFPKVEFKKLGRQHLTVRLWQGKQMLYGRKYPVILDYAPLRLSFTYPQYSQCYFPGQATNRISGMVAVNKSGVETVRMSIGSQTYSLPVKDGKAFFDLQQNLSPGVHEVSVELTAPDGSAEKINTTVRVLEKQAKMLWVEDGRLIVNGKATFHLGWYGSNWLMSKKYLDKYPTIDSRTPYNSGGWVGVEAGRLIKGIESKEGTFDVRPSPELLEKIRERIEKNRNNDKFDFYYLCDEPECRGISPIWLKYQYDFIKELDPVHPVLIISRSPANYLSACDIMAPHPYINPRYNKEGERIYDRPVSASRKMIHEITDSGRKDKVAMLCPTAFAASKEQPIYASFDEARSILWSMAAAGGQGLMPYIHHEYISNHGLAAAYDHTYFAFDHLAPWLTSTSLLPLSVSNPEVEGRLLQHDGVLLLILANVSPASQAVQLQSPSLQKIPSLLRFCEEGEQTLRQGGFAIKLAPFQVLILTSRKLDDGLESIPMVREKYLAAEKARLANGNLLLNKYSEVEVGASTYDPNLSMAFQRSLLINGITDDLAWRPIWDQQPWYELSFPVMVPEFNLVRIHGAGFAGASVQIWKRGEWQTPEPENRKEEKYLLELQFPQTQRTVKVRINFVCKKPRDFKNIELYEVELLNRN